MSVEQKIAKITHTTFGWEDHGILTCVLHLDYGDAGRQGAGTYCLDSYNKRLKEREGTAFGLEFLMRCMEAAGVREWEKLPGRTVYAWAEHTKVHGIGPLPTEPGRKFMFSELTDKYASELAA